MTGPTALAVPSPATGPKGTAADCPLERLHREHLAFRLLCDELDALAQARLPDPAGAAAALLALCHHVPLHEMLEVEGLFPRLRRSAEPEDAVDGWLDRLAADHAARDLQATAAVPVLAAMAGGALPDLAARGALSAFAQAKRRHLRLEDAVLLPLARLRLTAADRADLVTELARRPVLPGTPGVP